MKTLTKLSINPEKVLNNDELKGLKGGWWGVCWIYYNPGVDLYYTSSGSEEEAEAECTALYSPTNGYCDCVEM